MRELVDCSQCKRSAIIQKIKHTAEKPDDYSQSQPPPQDPYELLNKHLRELSLKIKHSAIIKNKILKITDKLRATTQ